MSQRPSPPPCSAGPLPPSRGSSLSPNGVYPILGRSFLVFFLSIGLGATVTVACGYCSGDSARDACAGSAFSCCASSVGFGHREDVSCHKADFGARAGCTSTEWRPGDVAVFKMVNGGVVSCCLVGSMNGLGSDGDNENMRTETLAPDVWMKISSLNGHAKDTDWVFLNVSSLRNVEISPFLHYGKESLLTPLNLSFLTVTNAYKNRVLHIYESFSADLQCYTYGLQKLALALSEFTSIALIFLLRCVWFIFSTFSVADKLGSFISLVRGLAFETPNMIESLVGIDIPFEKLLCRNLLIHNSFNEVYHVYKMNAWVFSSEYTSELVHVVFLVEGFRTSTECKHSLADQKCFKVGGSKLSLQRLDIGSHQQSEISAQKILPILDMNSCKEGKDLGAVHLKMWRFKLDGVCKIAPMKVSTNEEKYTNTRTGPLQCIADVLVPMKTKILEADELICTNWRLQGTTFVTFVNKEHEPLFPVAPVGIHFSKWIYVHNPSHQPVMMQFVLNSGEFVSQCKSTDEIDKHALSSRFIELDFIATRRRFSTFDPATNEAFENPSEIVLLGPVVFYPSNRCMWRSSALIWHNLLGEEWFPIIAFDSSKLSIILMGSEPLWKHDFNYCLINSSSSLDLLSYTGDTRSFCSHCMPKEIFAKHTGELPLEVGKVKASGADCSFDESMVHECNGLTLEPGESMRFLVSYEEDFSTATDCRDFELALATGVFLVPLKSGLPVYLLSFCSRTFFQSLQWTVAPFICATVCMLMLLLICIIPNSFLLGSEEYCNEVDNTMNGLSKTRKIHFHHHSGKFSRSSRGDENPQDGFANGYHICGSAMLDEHEWTELKQNFGHQKEIAFSSPMSTVKPIKGFNKCGMLEEPESGNLSTGFVKEKRRRKRRPAITGLAAKLNASSSQSGNSTPSSPSSSNASTPKQTSPHSPGSVDISADLSSEQKHHKGHALEDTMKAKVLETEKNCIMARLMPNQLELPNYPNLTGKSITILPLVKCPEYGFHESCVAARTVLPLRSPVVPSGRAPGPKRSRDKTIRTEEKNGIANGVTYDIWGNYFSENLLCWKKDLATKMLGTAEGGSQSFFTRDPTPL